MYTFPITPPKSSPDRWGGLAIGLRPPIFQRKTNKKSDIFIIKVLPEW